LQYLQHENLKSQKEGDELNPIAFGQAHSDNDKAEEFPP
jgi:hypothetical protein